MIIGIGIDIVEIKRIQEAAERFGSRFIQRIFTRGEIAYCESRLNRFQHYAVRFAAKEALLKALGSGLRDGFAWGDIEVINDKLGKPGISGAGKMKQILLSSQVHVSLTHTETVGAAVVILEK